MAAAAVSTSMGGVLVLVLVAVSGDVVVVVVVVVAVVVVGCVAVVVVAKVGGKVDAVDDATKFNCPLDSKYLRSSMRFISMNPMGYSYSGM